MKAIILVDSDILIDVGRNQDVAKNYLELLQKEGQTLAISTITVMELMVGARNRRETVAIQKLVDNFFPVHITPDIDREAINLLKQYRLSHGLLIPDALIAATAVFFDCPLASKNQRDYRFINQLNLLPYPTN